MLVAQAHSFRQQERLAITLAWVAGYTNVVGLVACGVAVSHMSGHTSRLGHDAAEGRWGMAWLAAFAVGCFLAGAIVSGLSTEFARMRGRKSVYVLPMALEAAALTAFGVLSAWLGGSQAFGSDGSGGGAALWCATACACFAMGIQNATITRISGGVVRTTHVTGVVTDLGLEIAHVALPHERHRPRAAEAPHGISHGERIALLASIVGSFAFGAGLAALVHDRWPGWSMALPVAFLAWVILQDVRRPIADLEPDELVAGSLGIDLPPNVGVWSLRCAGGRRGGTHRLPNLHLWADDLPPAVDVVVLDLGSADDVDPEGAEDLRSVAERLQHSRRALVLAGVDARRFAQLRAAGVLGVLPLGSVTDDIDLAVAYAIERAGEFAARGA